MQTTKQLGSALSLLRTAETKLVQRLEALRSEETAVAAELERVRGALQQLGPEGEAPAPPSGHPSPKGTLTDAEAMEVLLRCLADGPKTARQLKDNLLQAAKAQGRTGTGLHLVLKRLFKSGQLRQQGDLVALAQAGAAE